MASVVKVTKERGLVVFGLDTGKTVTYNLATGEYIGSSGKPVKRLTGQFSGQKLYEIKDAFEDKAFYKFLDHVERRNRQSSFSSSNGSLSRALNLASKYSACESWIRIGILPDSTIAIPVGKAPKDLLKWIRITGKFNINSYASLSYSQVKGWIDNQVVLQSMMSCRDKYPNFVDDVIFKMISMRGFAGEIRNLINRYGYGSTSALLEYLHNITEYEAVELKDLVHDLDDYNRMQSLMTDNGKYERYPRCFLTTDRIVTRNFQRFEKEYNKEAFRRTYDAELEFIDEKYAFICPQSPDEIKDEAVQQQHCVASYIDKVTAGECHIIFMRDKSEKEKSLITLEVRGDYIRQARGHLNRSATPEEKEAIDRYEKLIRRRKGSVAA